MNKLNLFSLAAVLAGLLGSALAIEEPKPEARIQTLLENAAKSLDTITSNVADRFGVNLRFSCGLVASKKGIEAIMKNPYYEECIKKHFKEGPVMLDILLTADGKPITYINNYDKIPYLEKVASRVTSSEWKNHLQTSISKVKDSCQKYIDAVGPVYEEAEKSVSADSRMFNDESYNKPLIALKICRYYVAFDMDKDAVKALGKAAKTELKEAKERRRIHIENEQQFGGSGFNSGGMGTSGSNDMGGLFLGLSFGSMF